MSSNIYRVVVTHDDGEATFEVTARAITDAFDEGREVSMNLPQRRAG